MMTRTRKPAPKSETSFEPKRSRFAPRPFAPKAEGGEGSSSCCEPRVDFSLADIDIFPKETVQPKLRLGPVGDRYEQEADRVARRVVETISSPDQDSVQKKDGEDEDELDLKELEEDEELCRKAAGVAPAGGADVGPGLESAIRGARGQGQPLSDGVRQPMERAFGADFGRVRVHTDGKADSLNRSIQARAFTTGQDIFLRQGEYRPGSAEGQRLLAHELTHVVQQNGGAVKRAQMQATRRVTQAKEEAPPNRTGMPDHLKSGLERLSGMDLSDVRVHHSSPKPAELNALAYTQGREIYVASGQERHLPHEGWHAVQQMQGRVRATMQMKGVSINDDAALECEADVMGEKVAASCAKAANQKGRYATDIIQPPVQRQVVLNDARDISAWDDDDMLNWGSEVLEDVIEELKENFNWTSDLVDNFKKLVAYQDLFKFRDYNHLNNFVHGNLNDPPSKDIDEGTAMMMDEIAGQFGSSFKGANIPFSGSRVYAVGQRGGLNPDIWATQNSATGHIPSKYQSVVKTWDFELPVQVFLDQLKFPSNTKKAFDTAGLSRPSVMASNAHAEVNQYVQLALFAAAHGLNLKDIGLVIGSDIAHCAECYWALAALAKNGGGTFLSFTGCENRLFERWREPWVGFYKSYEPNPFRKEDGSFKKNKLANKNFAVGSYSAAELNAVSPFKIYK